MFQLGSHCRLCYPRIRTVRCTANKALTHGFQLIFRLWFIYEGLPRSGPVPRKQIIDRILSRNRNVDGVHSGFRGQSYLSNQFLSKILRFRISHKNRQSINKNQTFSSRCQIGGATFVDGRLGYKKFESMAMVCPLFQRQKLICCNH